MPIHDWTRVPSGLFHHFHQDWSVEIARALNRGVLPDGLYALVEQRVDGPEPDVIAVETGGGLSSDGGGVAVAEPRARIVEKLETEAVGYARKANRVTVRHPLGDVVAVIEIVSPGNKDSRNSLRSFVEKSAAFLRAGINLVVVDLFPPTPRDPQGVHKAIADEFVDRPFEPPADKPLTLASYAAGYPLTAYVEPVAVGDEFPAVPLFLTREFHVPVPLGPTYDATWAVCPRPIRDAVAPPPEPPR